MTLKVLDELETFSPGAFYREFREFMRILMTFLGKTSRSPSEFAQKAEHPNYDGFLLVFSRNVITIRMNSRNSLDNAPGKKVSK